MKKIIALLLVFLLVGCAKEKEVKDYYIYVTDSNLSTVYTLLNLVKTDDNKSFIWYTDTDLINTDYLNANKNIKISKNIGKFDKNLIKEINEFIKDNNSNSKFHLMLDEKYYLLEFELNLKDNYDVTIFSNGIDSYNNYYDYEFENGYEIYKKHENEFNGFKDNFDLDNYDHNYLLISAKRDNTRYYLQYPEYITAYEDKVNDEIKKVNFVLDDPKTIYNSLTTDQRASLLKIINVDKKDYDNKYFTSTKPFLVIIGSNTSKYTKDEMKDMIKQVYDTYKDNYTILYNVNDYSLTKVEQEYLDELNIKVLPENIPMEIITFIYSDLKIGGFPNSLLLSTKTEDVIFLFAKNNEELDIPLNKMINEKYKIDYIQPITK